MKKSHTPHHLVISFLAHVSTQIHSFSQNSTVWPSAMLNMHFISVGWGLTCWHGRGLVTQAGMHAVTGEPPILNQACVRSRVPYIDLGHVRLEPIVALLSRCHFPILIRTSSRQCQLCVLGPIPGCGFISLFSVGMHQLVLVNSNNPVIRDYWHRTLSIVWHLQK